MLQRNVLFNLQVFGDFPAIFLFLISSFIVEQTLCDFNSFKLVELHFMAQKVNIYWWMSHVSLRIMFNIYGLHFVEIGSFCAYFLKSFIINGY